MDSEDETIDLEAAKEAILSYALKLQATHQLEKIPLAVAMDITMRDMDSPPGLAKVAMLRADSKRGSRDRSRVHDAAAPEEALTQREERKSLQSLYVKDKKMELIERFAAREKMWRQEPEERERMIKEAEKIPARHGVGSIDEFLDALFNTTKESGRKERLNLSTDPPKTGQKVWRVVVREPQSPWELAYGPSGRCRGS